MKRSQIKRRPMADSVLQSLEPEERDYQEHDGNGLYFRVKKNGSKSWNLRYKRPNGKWAWKGMGGFPAKSARAARQEARELLGKASDGIDLAGYKDGIQKDKPTFRVIAESWYRRQEESGRSPQTLSQMRRYMDNDMYPVIGNKPVDEVTRGDCARIQSRLEDRGAFTPAGKVRRWINRIYSLAIAEGTCEMNPASELKHLAKEGPKEQRYPHLHEPELPAFLRAMRESRSQWNTLNLIRTVLRNACRPGMARFAEWDEMDLDAALWIIPPEKMKMRREHVMPLPNQTVADLREMQAVTGRGRWVYPGRGWVNPVMSEVTINKALALMGYKGKLVGHGARHTASTLLREHGWNRDLVEAQLAHEEEGVAGVYNQAKYVEKRRKMVQWYADYLEALERGITKDDKEAFAARVIR